MYVISNGTYFLSVRTCSRGTQWGIARAWTEDPRGALAYATREEAEDVMLREFGADYSDLLQVVEVQS